MRFIAKYWSLVPFTLFMVMFCLATHLDLQLKLALLAAAGPAIQLFDFFTKRNRRVIRPTLQLVANDDRDEPALSRRNPKRWEEIQKM